MTRSRWARSRPCLAHDTEVAAYLLEPARRAYPFRELCEERGFAAAVEGEAAADAVLVEALAAWQREEIRGRGLTDLLVEVELPLVRVLRDMEKRGLKLDTTLLKQISDRVKDEANSLEREIFQLCGDRVHARLAPAARGGPVRQARPVTQAPRQDRLLDRRARAAGDPLRARGDPEDRALARAHQARPDLPGRAAPAARAPTAACTRPSTRPPRQPVACRPTTRTCRTSRSAPSSVARSGPASSPSPATCSSRPTTRRSSCGCWPTSPTRTCSRRSSAAARTSTRRPRCACSTSPPTRSIRACARSPR